MNSIKDFFKKYWYFTIICFILVCGVFFRLEAYFINKIFSFDEAQLVYNVIQNNGVLWAFKPLENYQIAPSFFLIGTKFLTLIFGESEYVFRFLPFVNGILSIFVFYILSKKILFKKRTIIFANFLFAINYPLVLYSTEFKQYSGDVLVFMLVLMYCARVNLDNLKLSQILKLSIIFTILFFVSQPVVFLLFGFIFYHFLKTLKSKQYNISNFKFCLVPIMPLICVFLYKFSIPDNFNNYMDNFWEIGFLSFKNFIPLLKENYNFFTAQGKYLILLIPFMIIGFFIFVLQKDKINRIFLCTFFGIILASILHFYPLLSRVILFLVPFFIIFVSKCFDFIIFNKKTDKILSIILILFTALFALMFQTKIIFKNSLQPFFDRNESLVINSILIENFGMNDDVLILPRTSKTVYFYYSRHLNFRPRNIIRVKSYEIEDFTKTLNSLEYGKTYWVYLVGFSSRRPQTKAIDNIDKLLNKDIDSATTSMGLYLIRLKDIN